MIEKGTWDKPPPTTVSQAERAGHVAYHLGTAVTNNPYSTRTNASLHMGWTRGWMRAEAENDAKSIGAVEPVVTDNWRERGFLSPQIEDAVKHTAAEKLRILNEAGTRTPLPEVKFTLLPGAKETPGGHHAHFDYEVKSWPWFFEPMIAGNKLHDMRDKTERPYRVGDRMLLREFDPRGTGYTGREAIARITYITSNETPCAMSSNALANDACILSVDVYELGDTDRSK